MPQLNVCGYSTKLQFDLFMRSLYNAVAASLRMRIRMRIRIRYNPEWDVSSQYQYAIPALYRLSNHA